MKTPSQPWTTLLPSRGCLQVWRRHFLVWRKTAIASLVGNLGEPLLTLVAMGFGLGRFIGEIDGASYLLYVTAGLIATSSMNTATFEALYGAFTRMTRQNTFEAMLTTPLSVADIVTGEILWAASKAFIASLSILLVGMILTGIPIHAALLILPLAFGSGMLFAAMGMVTTALSPSYDFFLYYVTLVTTPMFLFCGIFFPISTLPASFQPWVDLLPLTHVIALIRPLTLDQIPEHALTHLAILLLITTLSYALAVLLIRRRILV
ncbi:MAG: ABC transporter permease [Magnetococcales bacterium]|nr:ABC transporter permease [Magnetococcales bacterium]MBF0321820.1 ABC transporter permease [Magnetococcales bacterium]